MADLSGRLAKLTPGQRAVLDRRLRERGDTAAGAVPAITRRSPGPTHALTVDQERIWLIHQFDPSDPAYNIFFAARLRGNLVIKAVERAANDFVARHEPMRTTFEAVGDRPSAVVHAQATLDVPVVDLRDVPVTEREQTMRRLAVDELRRPFDLRTCPLIRITLLRMADDEHVLLGTVDHLVWDRASLGIFNKEFAELYSAHVTGREPDLPALELHYGDYAEWQPTWLRDEVATTHIPYWRQQLENAELMLDLPTDRPRPPVQTFHGARYQFRLTAQLTQAIRTLARSENVTVNVALLAAWQLLLHRLSGQQDIVVGTTSSTRARPETESMVGYFLTMLPLRVRVRPEMTFQELLRAARAAVVGAFDHHDVPFGVLLDALDINRDPSRNPIYQSTFIFVDFVHEEHDPLPGLQSETIMFDNLTAKDDVTLGFFDDRSLGADHYFGLLEYNTDLFDEQTIIRMSEQLIQLLEQVVADAAGRVGEYTLMSSEQARRIVVDWNDTGTERDTDATLDGLILDQAERTPDAVAVRCDQQRLTYRELSARAGVIAQALRQQGVRPEIVVGVCLERSCDLVAALLGVLRAGGAYLPLDPTHPTERLAGLVRRSDAHTVITTAEHLDRLGPGQFGQILLDERTEPLAGGAEFTVTQPPRSGDRLAYVTYTSGSTGTPKGVEVTHANLVNVLTDMATRCNLAEGDVLAAVTPVTFDIAGLELFAPLLVGATVTVVPRSDAQHGAALMSALQECGATVLQATPATWRLLLEAGWCNPAVIRMLVGGEALPPSLATAMAALPGRAWNVYGPTETTIWSTIWPIPADGTRIAIGRPVANTQVYVLDANLDPVPIGVPGELYIGGGGVARGYRAAPRLTAERFVPDHLGGVHGARLYRTGDRARWQRDGTLLFLGRDDNQVKLRGHRIELGEIETRLEQHPDVGRCVAIVREDRAGDARLVAYVEPAQTQTAQTQTAQTEPAVAVLMAHLRTTLPDFMVPSAIVVIDELALTPNGKLDRRALPAPSSDRDGKDHEAPRDALELQIARIWEDVLDVRPVGLQDRFFDLGGYSLLVLRLMADLEREFGVALPMAAIFQGATVEQFARMLRDGFRPETAVHAVRLRAGTEHERPIFLVHPAGSEVVCYLPFAELIEPAGRSLYALASPPPVDGRFPHESFEERAAAFAQLIRDLQPTGPYDLVGWCYGGSNAYATAVELERDGDEVSVVVIDAHPPGIVDIEPDRADIITAIAANLQWDYSPESTSIDDLRRMSPDEQIDYLLGIARAANYLPPDSGRAQIEAVVDMWIANLELLWRYQPAPLRGSLTMIRARDGDRAPFKAWEALAEGEFVLLDAPGNHYTVVRPPHVRTVAAMVSGVRAEMGGAQS